MLDEQKQSARGALIRYIDLSQDKRAFIGHSTDVAQAANAIPESTGTSPDRATAVAAPHSSVSDVATRKAELKPKRDRTERSSAAEKKTDKTKKPDRHR